MSVRGDLLDPEHMAAMGRGRDVVEERDDEAPACTNLQRPNQLHETSPGLQTYLVRLSAIVLQTLALLVVWECQPT